MIIQHRLIAMYFTVAVILSALLLVSSATLATENPLRPSDQMVLQDY